MLLKCKRCGKEWDYTGNMKFYASCPDCKSSVRIKGATSENTSEELCSGKNKKKVNMKKTIQLKHAEKVFPSKITRMRPHDLTIRIQQKAAYLSVTESRHLMRIVDSFHLDAHGEWDLLITRTGGRIKIESF